MSADRDSSEAAGRLQLVDPGPEWRDEFAALAGDFSADGESRYMPAIADFDGYLRELADYAAGRNLPPDHVPQTTYWGMVDGRLVGSLRLRHRLTPDLECEGGHIGYDVRPSWRNRGMATRMLALGLERARALGITRVLVTCDADNVASRRVIEKNRGQLVGSSDASDRDVEVLRFEIEL